MQADNIKAVEEVFPEKFILYRLPAGSYCGSQYPDIGFKRSFTTNPVEFAVF